MYILLMSSVSNCFRWPGSDIQLAVFGVINRIPEKTYKTTPRLPSWIDPDYSVCGGQFEGVPLLFILV